MNDDGKSTNEIRMIAADVVHQQTAVCEARRDNLDDKLKELAETVKANAVAIAALTTSVATMSATVTPLCATVKEHNGDIEELKGRPAIWAAIGAAIPTLLGVLLWWFSK